MASSCARDGALPGCPWLRRISPRFHTGKRADHRCARAGAFTPLVNINPVKDVHILWFTFPAGINALAALVSIGVSGIYRSFLLTVTGSFIARARGWEPKVTFRLERWACPVSVLAAVYLALILITVIAPTRPSSECGALFNLDWITLVSRWRSCSSARSTTSLPGRTAASARTGPPRWNRPARSKTSAEQ